MTAESKINYKWNQHPIISTVLWMLGNENKNENKENGALVGGTNASLKWKDEKDGGDINEYFSQVQIIDTSMSKKSDDEETQLRPGASKFNQDYLDKPRVADGTEVNPPAGEFTPSPQWGFWVAITPPQQEIFASNHAADSLANA
jgi:hypothetical protein